MSTQQNEHPEAVLQRTFGFPAFREGQEPVVTRLLAGKSVLAVFPTGAGKSLCYQLPALLLDGLTVVISPLIALMKDQLDFLVSKGVAAARLDSSLDKAETLQVYDDLRAGRLKLLYISPERLGNERFLQSLQRYQISLLAIDEAHCISEWGHNFRPDYLKIARLARDLAVERVLALTATATPQVARDIAAAFAIDEVDMIHTGFYRPNLSLRVTPCTPETRDALLLSRLRERAPGPTIVYVTLQRTAERVADSLVRHGFDARPYHAGMENEERHAVQDAFMASENAVIVATIAFGMGIDKRDIRYIYHYNLPKSLESYSQEIGRAGRDGLPSVCETFACRDDVVVLENFSYGDTPTPEAVSGLVADVLARGREFDVSTYDLSYAYDVRILVVKTLLTYLELEGAIESVGSFYTEYRYKPLKPMEEIVGRFDVDRAMFLRAVFDQAKVGRVWHTLDLAKTSDTLREPRERIVAALDYLHQQGDIELEAAGVRDAFRVKQAPSDVDGLVRNLTERFLEREAHDIQRIREVIDLAEHDGCLTQKLLAHFGETRPVCGHCSRCAGDPGGPLAPARYTPPGEREIALVRQLRAEGHAALAHPRQLARFLCGVSSPATSRARLRSHPHFASLETVPFHEILAFSDQA